MLQHIFPATFNCLLCGLALDLVNFQFILVYFREFPHGRLPKNCATLVELETEDGHGRGQRGLLPPVGTTITSILFLFDISEHFNHMSKATKSHRDNYT